MINKQPARRRRGRLSDHTPRTIAIMGSFAILVTGCQSTADHTKISYPYERARGPFTVVDVVDGDTIWVRDDGERTKVRLIGIDTPETKDPRRPVDCFGPEASARMTRLLQGRSVFLELDSSQGSRDRYGRELAYVWADKSLINLTMIAGGFAREYTYAAPYRYQRQFRATEAAARTQRQGLWSACNRLTKGGSRA